jgi:hypothetical protein
VLAACTAGVAQFEVQVHVPGMDGQTLSHRQGTGLVCLRACGLTVPWSCSRRRGQPPLCITRARRSVNREAAGQAGAAPNSEAPVGGCGRPERIEVKISQRLSVVR